MVLIKNAAVSTVKNIYVRDQRQNDLINQFDFFLRSSADMKTFIVIFWCDASVQKPHPASWTAGWWLVDTETNVILMAS